MTTDGPETVEDAAETVVLDDPESMHGTIIERSESEAASKDGEADDAQDHDLNRPAPFARSSFSS